LSNTVLFLLWDDDLLDVRLLLPELCRLSFDGSALEAPYPNRAPELFDRAEVEISGALSSVASSSISMSSFTLLDPGLALSEDTKGWWY
jgi:hypothetical protein